mmetsp:Transcript_32245/g.51707  ORF Transcript_32245/g.51707 Transcript_32245/m.51707 type:complete len:207 (-) Transcript_32245:379-999(-)
MVFQAVELDSHPGAAVHSQHTHAGAGSRRRDTLHCSLVPGMDETPFSERLVCFRWRVYPVQPVHDSGALTHRRRRLSVLQSAQHVVRNHHRHLHCVRVALHRLDMRLPRRSIHIPVFGAFVDEPISALPVYQSSGQTERLSSCAAAAIVANHSLRIAQLYNGNHKCRAQTLRDGTSGNDTRCHSVLSGGCFHCVVVEIERNRNRLG